MPSPRKKAGDLSPRDKPEVVTPEIVKSDAPPADAKPVRLTKEGKPFREQRRGKIDKLPDEVRGELDHRLATNSFRNYKWLSRWLEEEHSARISPSAINYRKKHKIDLKLLPVKYATEEARAIVEAAGGDNEEINRVLTTLVQTKLYEMLIQMDTVIEAFDTAEHANEHSANILAEREKNNRDPTKTSAAGEHAAEDGAHARKVPNKAALAAVTALVKNTATIGHHVIDTERWDLDRDIKLAQQIEAANQKVSKVATEAGLSPEVEKTIRAALMEIKL
jgi:hypothetical protein